MHHRTISCQCLFFILILAHVIYEHMQPNKNIMMPIEIGTIVILMIVTIYSVLSWHGEQKIIHGTSTGITADSALLLTGEETFTIYNIPKEYREYLLDQSVPTTIVIHKNRLGKWIYCEEY